MTLYEVGQRKRQYGAYPCFKPTAAYNGALRNSQNCATQGPTSTIGLATFAELSNQVKKYDCLSVCTVFDSLELEVPVQHAATVINLAFDVLDNYPLEAFPFMELPIGSDAECGISWGEAEHVDKGVTQKEIESLLVKIREKSFASFGGPIYN